jgi:hypothetical protein
MAKKLKYKLEIKYYTINWKQRTNSVKKQTAVVPKAKEI